jgi:hypothetical protein
MEVPPGLLAAMEGDYNASQMAAVRSGLAGDDVLLIQGPPGDSSVGERSACSDAVISSTLMVSSVDNFFI